jgi:hypothetical protein
MTHWGKIKNVYDRSVIEELDNNIVTNEHD